MGNIVIVTPAIGDGAAVLESSVSSASMPAENIQKLQPTERWRSTAVNPAYAELDLGSSLSFDFAAFLWTNSTTSTTMRLRVATSKANLVTSPTYDSGATAVWAGQSLASWDRTHGIIDLETFTPSVGSKGTQTQRYVRIDLDEASHPDGYIEMGRFFLGLKYQPELNVDWGSSHPMFQEDVVAGDAEGGPRFPVVRSRHNDVEGTIQMQTEAEFLDNWHSIARLRGSSADVLYVHDPDSSRVHEGIVHGTFTARANSLPRYSIWEVSFAIRGLD